jgi:hypothetical protein
MTRKACFGGCGPCDGYLPGYGFPGGPGVGVGSAIGVLRGGPLVGDCLLPCGPTNPATGPLCGPLCASVCTRPRCLIPTTRLQIVKIKTDLIPLNIDCHIVAIGELFKCLHHKYKAGNPEKVYRVEYKYILPKDVSHGRKLPVGTKVKLPYAPDHTQNCYSMEPLIQYIHHYNLLCASECYNSEFNERFCAFIKAYHDLAKFFSLFPDCFSCKDLRNICLYGGLSPKCYKKLERHLKAIRCIIRDGACIVKDLNEYYIELQNMGVLTLNQIVNYGINKDSRVYNLLNQETKRDYVYATTDL